MTPNLDATDAAMVALLQSDARMSVRAMAEALGVSRATAYQRLNRLVDTGVVRKFTVDVDHTALGLHTSAYVEISMQQNAWRSVREGLRKIDAVKAVYLLGGAFDALVLVRATDNHALRDVLLQEIQAIEGVRGTRTLLILEEVDSDDLR